MFDNLSGTCQNSSFPMATERSPGVLHCSSHLDEIRQTSCHCAPQPGLFLNKFQDPTREMASIAFLKDWIKAISTSKHSPTIIGSALAYPFLFPPRMRLGGGIIVGDFLARLNIASCGSHLISKPPGIGLTTVVHILTVVKRENKSILPASISKMLLFYWSLSQLLKSELNIVRACGP